MRRLAGPNNRQNVVVGYNDSFQGPVKTVQLLNACGLLAVYFSIQILIWNTTNYMAVLDRF